MESQGDKVPQKLKMFYEIMLLGWTRVKDLKHLHYSYCDVQICCDRHRVCGRSTTKKISKRTIAKLLLLSVL